jgi:hypothetical protein
MFGWLKDRFTNAGKLEKAARNAKAAANKFGTTNSRNAAKKEALDLEVAASTTKQTVEMAQKELERVQKSCSTSINNAKTSLRAAQASHDKVKDTTFQRIKRFATLGRAGWSASRSAAVNIAQKRMENAATKKRDQLRALAAKQKAAMDAEEAALRRRKELIASALNTANSAANAAKKSTLTSVTNFKPSNNGKFELFLKSENSNTEANTSRPGTPVGGGRGRTRKPRRR